jgi:uncharacterized membrane protein required for colicin V production
MAIASKNQSFNFDTGWVDLVVVLLLAWGVMRGRKRGMSEELLDIIKWTLIVVIAAAIYAPLGQFVSQVSFLSLFTCYVGVYAMVVVIAMLICSAIRHNGNNKLVGSDTFGNAEYYLGMMAGGFRYLCIVLVGMAFLNARYYTPAEIQAKSKYQQDNFGSSFFLTVPDLQRDVFVESLTGRLAHEYLNVALIRPTPPTGKAPREQDTSRRRREGKLDAILNDKTPKRP